MPRRRFTTFVFVAVFGLTVLLFSSSTSRRVVPDVVKARLPELPDFDGLNLHLTWQKSGRRPAEQRNSTSGDASWFSDWKWLNPFSSSVTLDEDRAVLPPLAPRIPVYTYYETDPTQDKAAAEADQALLVTWRRAWWAHGFRPIVLTQAESMSHPSFRALKDKKLSEALEYDISRWLAWSHMGTGLLSSWRCVPMTHREDLMLSSLRRGQYEKLTRFEDTGLGLFAGEKAQIDAALGEAFQNMRLNTPSDFFEFITQKHFKVEHGSSVAYYETHTISTKYPSLASLIDKDPVNGVYELNRLISGHLHTIWQNSFSNGINVLKPLPAHTTKLVEPGRHLARLLSQCPESMLQSSCPPNDPKCSPCVTSRLTVRVDESFRNKSSIFAIATIPHPLTLISLDSLNMDFNVSHIRRNTQRDPWIRTATRSFLGDGRGAPSRVVALKEVMASEHLQHRGLWFTVEQFPAKFLAPPTKPKSPTNEPHPEEDQVPSFPEHWLEELDWHFGFPIPRKLVSHGESHSPVPGQGREIKGLPEEIKSSYDPPAPTYEETQMEIRIIEASRSTINSNKQHIKKMRTIAEAWNLADTEIWKFARAHRARSIMERHQWEEEEAALSSPGSVRGGRFWRRLES